MCGQQGMGDEKQLSYLAEIKRGCSACSDAGRYYLITGLEILRNILEL